MNKKGTTLAELIISIALISVVLLFMIKLLIDLNDAETNNTYAKDNQINRAEILRMIGNDLNSKNIASISDSESNENKLVINIEFTDGTNATIEAEEKKIKYTDSDDESRTWNIEGGTIYTKKANVYYAEDNNASGKNYYSLSIDIEIHTTNEKNKLCNNNTLDDIIINYIGKLDDLDERTSDYFKRSDIGCLGVTCFSSSDPCTS